MPNAPEIVATDWEAARLKITLDTGTETSVKQSPKDDTDINTIVATYGRSGVWSNVNPVEARYGDFSQVVELREAIEITEHAEEEFYKLPAAVRAMADNSPVQFLEMLTDEGAVRALVAAGMPVNEPKKSDTPAPSLPAPGGIIPPVPTAPVA